MLIIVNGWFQSLMSIPPIDWLSQQPAGFALYGAGVLGILILGLGSMRGPEV